MSARAVKTGRADVFEAEHARAFAVAKGLPDDLLAVAALLDKVIAEGATLETFKRKLRHLLDAMGQVS